MSKVLRTAAIVVGAVALIATGVGALAGAGIAFTSLSAAGLAAVEGIATVASIAATALSAISSLTAPKPPGATVGGNPIDFKADPFAGLPYAMGRTLVGGNIVYWRAQDAFAGGAENDLQTFVSVLTCAGPVQSIDQRLIDTVDTSFDGSGAATGPLAGYAWHAEQLGAAPETSALAVAAGTSALPDGWTAAHKLSGLCAVMDRQRFDSKGKLFTSGAPKYGYVGHWVKVYDPRLDSTYPGGAGACRAKIETTYVWSDNPYLHALTWCLGRYANGKRVIGLGADVADIIVPAFVEGANVCEANGWKLGGVVYSRPDTKWNSLKAMLQAGGGVPLRVGAAISCTVRTPRVSLATIGAGDIVGKASLAATKRRRERKNIGFPRFRSEANAWAIVPTDAPVRVPAYITADGDERSLEIEYSLVQNATQAAQLITYELADSREFGPVTLPLKPLWMAYKPGDCITLDVPESAAQPMLIRSRSLAPATGIVTLTLESETTAKHAFALGKTGTPPPTASVAAHDPSVAAPGAGAWSISGVSLTSTGGAIPAIVVSGAIDNPTADAVVFEYRAYGMTNWIGTSLDAPTIVRKEFSTVTPGTAYEVAVSYRVRGVVGARRIIGPATAGSAAIVWSSVTGSGRPADNADVTATHVAAAITGQGGLATKNVVGATDLAVSVGGGNRVYNSSFELGTTGFGQYNKPPGTEPFTYWGLNGGGGRTGGDSLIMYWGVANTSTKGFYFAGVNAGILKPNSKYVISFYAIASLSGSSMTMGLAWSNAPASTTEVQNPLLTGGWQRYVFAITTGAVADPNGYVTAVGAGYGYIAFDDVQIEEGDVVTAYSPLAPTNADQLAYAGGATVGSLKPAEAGSNVTETRSAAAIAGQGIYATTAPGRLGPHPIHGAGYLDSNLIAWTGGDVVGNYRPQEAGANVTETRVAASIAGQSIYATSAPARLGPHPYFGAAYLDSMVVAYPGPGGNVVGNLKPQEAGANVTEGRTAAAFAGQGALATLNAVDYATQVTGKPSRSGMQTVGNGQIIQVYLTAGEAHVVDGGFGATSASGGGTVRATLIANGTVFATGSGFYVAPGEPGRETVSGTFTNGSAAQLVQFYVGHTGGTGLTVDAAQTFCRA